MTGDDLAFRPLTPALLPALERLFGPKGAVIGCWCQYFRVTPRAWKSGDGDARRALLREEVAAGGPAGVVALAGEEAVGWVRVTPRADVPRFNAKRTGRPEGGIEGVWAMTCFFVAPAWRKRGLMARLAAAGTDFAFSQGAVAVEAAALDTDRPLAFGEGFVGIASSLRKAGFVEVARRTPIRPLMRRTAP